MSDNLRDEFEEYIKKLTVEISKEIFLKQLEDLYTSYEENLQNTIQTSANLRDAVSDLSHGVQQACDTAAQVQEQSSSSLQAISNQITHMEAQTSDLFASMKRMNQKDRQTLLDELNAFGCQYNAAVQEIMTVSCTNISQRLSGVITCEQLQQFRTVLEQNTKESLQLANYINGVLKGEADRGMEQIRQAVNRTLDTQLQTINTRLSAVDSAVSQTLQARTEEISAIMLTSEKQLAVQLGEFQRKQKAAWASALEQQTKLVEQIGPDKQQVELIATNTLHIAKNTDTIEERVKQQQDELIRSNRNLQEATDQIYEMRKAMEEMQKQFEGSVQMLVMKADMDRRAARSEQIAHKLYTAFGSGMTLILFALLLVFQKPWKTFGLLPVLCATSIAAIVFLLVYLLGGSVARLIVAHTLSLSAPEDDDEEEEG